jgi:hypothetical protein
MEIFMKKLFALLDVFRKGNSVANPELWKHGGAALQAALVPFLVALASAVCTVLSYCFTLTPEVAAGIAGGVVAVVGVFVTYATSDKVGLPAKPVTERAPAAAAEADLRGPGG